MNFFQSQDLARKKTKLLLVYFALAVVLIILLLYGLLQGAYIAAGDSHNKRDASSQERIMQLWNPHLLAGVAVGVLINVAACSLFKFYELRNGGEAVAQLLGARPVNPATEGLAERRLLNIVEEMAIASGVPVPPVYVLENEKAINAFAAGHNPGDAVITVSHGALNYLTRDELQGVVAHEFSHILNGDMRLNLRLIGLIYGILFITIFGELLMRMAGSSRTSSSKSDDDRGRLAFFLLGLGVYAIGYFGVFLGNLIKAAISRQREYLADASAVQFTRNPDGISGALKKIGGLASGSRINSAHVEEASHMFFGDALGRSFDSLFATHPPLPDRILRIDPNFNGTFPSVVPVDRPETELEQKAPPRRSPLPHIPGIPANGEAIIFSPLAAVAQIGLPENAHAEYASEMLAGMPAALRSATEDPFTSRALMYVLLLDRSEVVRKRQLDYLKQTTDSGEFDETMRLAANITELQDACRLPLIDLALSALKRQSPGQYAQFRNHIEAIISADNQVDAFEFALRILLLRRLDENFRLRKRPAVLFQALGPLAPDIQTVLSMLAHAGADDVDHASQAFNLGATSLVRLKAPLTFLPESECGVDAVDLALGRLAKGSPKVKADVVEACAVCVGADDQITIREADLLRAVAGAMDCPMPPVINSSAA